VLDSGSADATLEIARSHGVRVVHHPFVSFAEQRNWALKTRFSCYQRCRSSSNRNGSMASTGTSELKWQLSDHGFNTPNRTTMWLKRSSRYAYGSSDGWDTKHGYRGDRIDF
jgi:hypothetical protein